MSTWWRVYCVELRICLPLLRQRPAQWLSRHPLVKHLLVGIVSIVQASSYSSTSATCGGITQLMAQTWLLNGGEEKEGGERIKYLTSVPLYVMLWIIVLEHDMFIFIHWLSLSDALWDRKGRKNCNWHPFLSYNQARSQDRFGVQNPPQVDFLNLNPPTKKTFLVHGEAKSGPFGRCRGVSLPWHPLATVTAHSASEKVNL